MRLRKLGNSGLTASEVSLGTAEIGLDYGFKGSPQYRRPSRQDSIRLIQRAVDRGINWLDTARAYGDSEEVIGLALKDLSPRPRISSKVIFEHPISDMDAPALRDHVFHSIESSLRALQVDAIDLLYIHNASEKLLRKTAIRDSLAEARSQGKIKLAGATCYGEEDALATLKDPLFQVLQVPFSLLNQKMSSESFRKPPARESASLCGRSSCGGCSRLRSISCPKGWRRFGTRPRRSCRFWVRRWTVLPRQPCVSAFPFRRSPRS